MGLRRHLTYANVSATLALVLAMSGSAYALVITGKQVANGSLTGRDIRSGSIPPGDLGFSAVATGEIAMSNASDASLLLLTPKEQATPIATVQSNIGKGFDALYGVGTVSLTNDGQTRARVQIRPYMDGQPHGDHVFVDTIEPGTTDIETVSFACDGSRGSHEVSLVVEVVEGSVTVGQREWSVVPVPMR